MAIYHLNVKNISRGDGRSVVTAAAYRAGTILPNDAEERLSDFAGRCDVVATDIRLPAGAPAWMADRTRLWNTVEIAERRKDARLAKEIEFALPRELPRDQWLAVARTMADAYAAKGFVVDIAIHDDGDRHNPHVHMLLTTRVVTMTGFGPKIRSADGRQFVTEARALWERIANEALGKAGAAVTIDSRSHAKRKLDQTPGRHRGPDPEERRARRRRQHERETMIPETPDADLPVPDPDGSPIHPRELDSAERRMLAEVRREEPPLFPSPDGDLAAAHAAISRQNSRDLSDDEAAAYRLAAEDHLDWLDGTASGENPADLEVLDRWENHLDWLDVDDQRSSPRREDGLEPERDHDRR